MNFIRKIIIFMIILLLLSCFAFLVTAWDMGAFSSIRLSFEDRGPYHIVICKKNSTYQFIGENIDIVKDYLGKNSINYTISAVILHEDPFTMSIDRIRSSGGCIISDSVMVDTLYTIRTIKKRRVLVASIKANPAIASYKTYPALKNQLRKEFIERDYEKQVLELYYKNGLVEVEVPVLK